MLSRWNWFHCPSTTDSRSREMLDAASLSLSDASSSVYSSRVRPQEEQPPLSLEDFWCQAQTNNQNLHNNSQKKYPIYQWRKLWGPNGCAKVLCVIKIYQTQRSLVYYGVLQKVGVRYVLGNTFFKEILPLPVGTSGFESTNQWTLRIPGPMIPTNVLSVPIF